MKPIQVDFKPSRIFIGLIISASLTSGLTLISTPLIWQIKLPIMLVIIIASVYTILHHGLLRMPGAIISLRVDINSELYVLRKDGKELKVRVAANTTVTPYLVVLNFQTSNVVWYQRLYNHTLIVLPDSTDSEAFRQLRVWLRWANNLGNTQTVVKP